MKVRMGFVSNSSSSSFMICLGSALVPGLYEKLDDTEKKIADVLFTSKDNFSILQTMDGEMGEGFIENFYEDTLEAIPELYSEHVNLDKDSLYHGNYDLRSDVQEIISDFTSKVQDIVKGLDKDRKDWVAERQDM